jgi:GNAT superfamily N-acetyltransferase
MLGGTMGEGKGMNEWRRGDYVISTDVDRIDFDMLHGFLTAAYWSQGVPRGTVERAVRNSLSFGLYRGGKQIGFARAVTDRATFAYLADVFVLPEERGTGLGKWLIQVIIGHPELQGLRRWTLATRDAHALYRQFGFGELATPERFMEIFDADVYSSAEVS